MHKEVLSGLLSLPLKNMLHSRWQICVGALRLSCCADTMLTRAFFQEDDLGFREEVAPSDGHLFSPTDQTAGQAGLLHLG